METPQLKLSAFEQWMVESNVKHITEERGLAAAEVLAILRANGYPRIAQGVEERLKEIAEAVEQELQNKWLQEHGDELDAEREAELKLFREGRL